MDAPGEKEPAGQSAQWPPPSGPKAPGSHKKVVHKTMPGAVLCEQGRQPLRPLFGCYLPIGHSAHSRCPAELPNHPAEQLTHASAPDPEKDPTAHVPEQDGLVRPDDDPYQPPTQLVQALAAKYMPGLQAEHADAPSGEYWPLGQGAQLEAPAAEYASALQTAQAVAAAAGAALSVAQPVQNAAPAAEYWPASQSRVHAGLVRPVVAPDLPAAQLEHAVAAESAYWPAAQVPEQPAVARPVVAPYWPAAHSAVQLEVERPVVAP
jgi:hypothetical protein